MYNNKYEDLLQVGPSFEALTENEMMVTEGEGTPLVVLTFATKMVASGAVSFVASSLTVMAVE